jgi:hypothetical protein
LKNKAKTSIIIAVVSIFLLISIEPILAEKKTEDARFQTTLLDTENVLANISVTWDSFLRRFSFKDLEPLVIINSSGINDFYFPEINGTIPQINFSVICKHRLNHSVIFPRFTRAYIAVSYNGTYILLNQSIKTPCKSLEWEYINFSIQSNEDFIPLETNGENITLDVEVGAYFFFFKLWGKLNH